MTRSKNQTNGFTIIEVMIVLAIAGLIMLIVFLAVPALQRSSRNTQRKADVSAILDSMSEYSTNNGGTLPNAAACFAVASGTLTVDCASTTDAASTAKLGYYTAVTLSATAFSGTLPSPATDTITVYEGTKCSNATTPTSTGAGARQIVALYGVENGSGSYAWQCQES